MKAYTTLYNCFANNSPMRFTIFQDILNFADGIKRIDLVLPYSSKIDEMIEEWGLDLNQRITIYELLTNILAKYPEHKVENQNAL